MIEEIEAGRLFSVKSQTTDGLFHIVDLQAYTCRCASFPGISFCKHICGVENNFPDLVVPRSLPIASQPWDEADDVQSRAFVLPTPIAQPVPAVSQEDTTLLDYIVKKLQLMQRTKASLTEPLASSLRQLDTTLTDVTNGSDVLPRTVTKVAPNQGTWNDTAEVMGAKRKGAKKRKNTDAYCGGQSSGKSAHPDARVGKKAKTAAVSEPAPSTTALTDSFEAGDLDLADGPTDAVPQELATRAKEATESPEMLLRQALALYNTMFPPDAPRTTSYYRDNNYVVTAPGTYYRTH
jgi:hypothetical protein